MSERTATLDRRFYLAHLLSTLSIVFLYWYYFLDGTIVSPLVNDITVAMLLLLTICLLLYQSLRATNGAAATLSVINVALFAILARGVVLLRVYYSILPDAHAYIIPAINVYEYNSLEFRELASWWDLTSLANWPLTQLISASAAKITSIDLMWFMRWQTPLLGGLFALAVFAMARVATGKTPTALVAALLGSLGAIVISYQTEYHPQGMAVLLFVFFFFLYLKSRAFPSYALRALVLLFVAAFVLTHHFSSIFISTLSAGFLMLAILSRLIPPRWGNFGRVASSLNEDYDLFILVTVAGAFYHFMIRPETITSWLYALTKMAPAGAALFGAASGTEPGWADDPLTAVPLLTVIANKMKWGVLLLAAVYIVSILRRPKTAELRLLVFMSSILIAGVVGNFLVWGPIDRMIAFYTPLVSVFAAITTCRLCTLDFRSLLSRVAQKVILAAVALLILGEVLSAQPPAFYFQNSQPNPYYGFANRLPIARQYVTAAGWVKRYTGDASFGTEYDTLTLTFFYARKHFGRTNFLPGYPWGLDYYVVNPGITYRARSYTHTELEDVLFRTYANGEIVIYARPGYF